MADETKPADSKPKMAKAVVAPRRTVDTPDGKFGPGKEVTLPAAEIERLRTLGFLVVPGAEALPVDIGPRFNYEGPGVSRAA